MQLNIREKIQEYIRVLKIMKKPTRDEFSVSVKVTGVGIAIIGFIGLVFYLIAKVFPTLFS